MLRQICVSLLLSAATIVASEPLSSNATGLRWSGRQSSSIASLPYTLAPDRPKDCPPCFDCSKPAFSCQQYGQCNEFDGQCRCPAGFGGQDCSQPRAQGDSCECTEGWTGLTCNVCESDKACIPLVPDGSTPRGFRPFESDPQDDEPSAVCYTGGLVVEQMHQMCDVTNRKIVDMLPDRPPQVTFSCDRPSATCGFQFWIGKIESFYCGLDKCTADAQSDNSTTYSCEKVTCSCIPGRMLCGEDGSVDISDFLTEEIKGPGQFACKSDGSGCTFEEPAMNQLINDIFGDSHISLRCQSGECVHYSDVPGYTQPAPPDNSKLVAISIAIAASVVVLAIILAWIFGRTQRSAGWRNGSIALRDDDGDDALVNKHVPASLQFLDMSYAVSGREVLSGVSGKVRAGEVMAIIGASGAGKSSLFDLLGRRAKRGVTSGTVVVNGRAVTDESAYRRLIGFVDQEDTLMGTLTVYETILNSALLRLPRDMSFEAKRMRTLETMHELGLLAIRNSRIGEAGKRALSGGEKRRVSIACELVTSPSILYLDEPTSGLDAYNAHNVVETLVTLARDYQRTVVLTIHQPRSDIVALFDRLVVLAQGRTVFSGQARRCADYLAAHGHPCPAGYNLADFLIDLTMEDVNAKQAQRSDSEASLTDAEQAAGGLSNGHQLSKASSNWTGHLSSRQQPPKPAQLGPTLQSLVNAFAASEEAKAVKRSTAEEGEQPAAAVRSYERASWATQLYILSGRSFKNLYRNPLLMLTHYAMSILIAVICAFLFHDVTGDIPGFQNRMGLFFFILALFGFSTLSSLGVFANERILFMRERANGYYSPSTYFIAKVLFDTIPLRVVPPFILGAIIYRPVGLVPSVAEFWKLILVLVLFNLVASSVVFLISVVISDTGVASLTGTLVMLFNLLFAGLLLNREKGFAGIEWLQNLSFFHAAFEALLVNELRYLTLVDHKYGVDINVPSAAILAQAFWWPDIATLAIIFASALLLAYIGLVYLVKERR